IYARGRTRPEIALEFGPSGAEAGPPMEVGNLAQVPRLGGRRRKRRPGPIGDGHDPPPFRGLMVMSPRSRGLPGLTLNSLWRLTNPWAPMSLYVAPGINDGKLSRPCASLKKSVLRATSVVSAAGPLTLDACEGGQ